MEPRQNLDELVIQRVRRTASEIVAATVCGAVFGAGVLFAIAEVWAGNAVDSADSIPLAYVLAAIGALLGAAIVLAYLRADYMRTQGELSESALTAEDYMLVQAPLMPLAWHPVPVVIPTAETAPIDTRLKSSRSRRVRRRPRRRGRTWRADARRTSLQLRATHQPPIQA